MLAPVNFLNYAELSTFNVSVTYEIRLARAEVCKFLVLPVCAHVHVCGLAFG